MAYQARFDGQQLEVTTKCRNYDKTLFGLCVRSSSATELITCTVSPAVENNQYRY
jgi:hypothetical protein